MQAHALLNVLAMKQTSLSAQPVARPSRTAAFTLIELLSVIAIIGILAAILIPTVNSVKASAQQAVCLSNLRQIAMGSLLYAQNNKNRLPGAPGVTVQRGVWDPATTTSIDYQDKAKTDVSTHLSTYITVYLETYKNKESIWSCRANEGALALKTTNQLSYLLNQNKTNGMNPVNPFGNSGVKPYRPAMLTEIVSAGSSKEEYTRVTSLGSIWMITDADSTNYGGNSSFPTKTAADAIAMPHKGGRNYAFFDGHAEYRKADNLPANP